MQLATLKKASKRRERRNGTSPRTRLSRAGLKAGSRPTCATRIYPVWRECGPARHPMEEAVVRRGNRVGRHHRRHERIRFWMAADQHGRLSAMQLTLMPRHFGGGQWYFVCSEQNRPVSVLWRPPGARFFRCRQYWGRRFAYRSQFGNEIDRAHIGRAKLKAKLCSPNLGDWRIPPKPPKMRWATYDRLIKQYLKYEAALGGAPTDFEMTRVRRAVATQFDIAGGGRSEHAIGWLPSRAPSRDASGP
jgi:hypothetical protein